MLKIVRVPALVLSTLSAALICGPSPASATVLGSTVSTFGVLAGSTVTNTGPSIITGNVGVSPGTAITGFPPGIVDAPYTIHAADAVALQAQNELTTAFNTVAGLAPNCNSPGVANLSGEDLGGQELIPGVYCFSSSAQLTGTLTLNDLGNPDAVFDFVIGSTLTTASASSVLVTNGGGDANIFWDVGSSATLGTTTDFVGDIAALTSITLNTGATITCGAALAETGAVTLDTNTISILCPAGAGAVAGSTYPAPEPSTLMGFGTALFALIGMGWRRSRLG